MNDLFLRSDDPWVGLLSAFGVAGVLLLLVLVRDASPRVRGIAAMAGATLTVYAIVRGFAGVPSMFAFLAAGEAFGDSGRRVLDILLVATGVAIGVYAVFWAHSQVAGTAVDVADDAIVTVEEPADDEPADDLLAVDAPPAAAFGTREWFATAGSWVDLAALVVALSLPTVVTGIGGGQLGDFLPFQRDVTATAALYYLVSGLVLAGPLLVVAHRIDLADQKPLLAAFGLLALRAIVLPIWPELFSNEFWTALAIGLMTGLMATAAFYLVRAAIPDDRTLVVAGALAALALLSLSAALASRVQLDGVGSFLDVENGDVQIPDDVFPTEFPGFTFGP